MKGTSNYIGFDCGNSSIRTVLGTFDGSHIKTEVVQQTPNQALQGYAYDYWDILSIFHTMQLAMKKTCSEVSSISSFGISTWGIDFGLLGRSGELLGNPLCYRNLLGTVGLNTLSDSDLHAMFGYTGIQNHPMNSLYQILGIREKLPEYPLAVKSLLTIPDLLNYLFTGERNSEVSIASTTQLLDMRKRTYCDSVFSKTGICKNWFPPLVGHGQIRGMLRSELASKLGIPAFPSISVPSHDTASAIVSVPTGEKDFAYISSGTWSLIGTELHEPIINSIVEKQGFSNEGGLHGSITLLKNSCGMHILQNIKRELEFTENRTYSWDEIVALAMPCLEAKTCKSFDPNDTSLYNPLSMIGAIRDLTGLEGIGDVVASAYMALAVSYAKGIEDLQVITGKEYPTIHIIGGGSRNAHLNQMTADISGKRVLAGPYEATSLGTIAVQVMHDNPHLTIQDIRKIIGDSVGIQEYLPAATLGK
ncbi:pentulose/hexulose kinase [Sphaerochaeta pleomorpha str. Grapes]|uniref:Pentulose/hexulose kinase n=1 Tax=Sphaerochaeta pleomorpha (strain ATCC BAA-1885 / DSM 22778 / Grapes) TaxID=158190 RepID=G8QVP2_SPHPG|nr:FGGY family carbohydrate kinase [Sphaerochaeta pleomorpha]AEV29334.1 pentulose/hexulose kinase [Sphaerochaeta pleomorpha str. Grapes]